MIVVEHAGEGALGAAFAEHMIAFGREALAPFGVGKLDLFHGGYVGVALGSINPASCACRAR